MEMGRVDGPILNWVRSHEAPMIAEALYKPVLASSMTRLVQNLVDLRRESGLTQSGLASLVQAMGLDHWRQTTVSRIESRTQDLTAQEVMALGGIFGRTLFEGTVLAWAGTEYAEVTEAAQQYAERAMELAALEQRLAMAQAELAAASGRAEEAQAQRDHAAFMVAETASKLAELRSTLNDAEDRAVRAQTQRDRDRRSADGSRGLLAEPGPVDDASPF